MKNLFKKIKNRLFPPKIELVFFVFEGPALPLSAPLQIVMIDSLRKFSADTRIPDLLKNDSSEKRLRDNDRFVYLTDGEEALSWGWVFGGTAFYLFEIDRTSCHKDNIFVYDFFTPEKHRNRGYYATLLSNIPSLLENPKVTVGAAIHNQASIRGIKKAGYIPFEMEFCEKNSSAF